MKILIKDFLELELYGNCLEENLYKEYKQYLCKRILKEFNAHEFLKYNKYKDSQIKKCAYNGFTFGILEFFNQDFWKAAGEKCKIEEFVKSIYELNCEQNIMTDNEILGSLARFLCGYDKQVDCRRKVENLPASEQNLYFRNQREDIDSKITDEEVNNKVMILKNLLKI